MPEFATPAPSDTMTEHGPKLPSIKDYMELHREAQTDALTGLLNQNAMKEAVANRLRQAGRSGERLVFFMFDLDKFKGEVNDKYGHPYGDKFLATVGSKLKQTLREGDLAGRMGGDEFAILASLAPREGEEQAPWHVLESMEARITDSTRSLLNEGEFAHLGASGVDISYGESIFNGQSAEELMKEADEKLYQKKRGKPDSRPS